MASFSSLLRSAQAVQVSTQEAQAASSSAKKAERADRISRILSDASKEPEKFCRIIRAQMGREERALFTLGQVKYRLEVIGDPSMQGILDEYIRQERGSEVDETLTDEEILALWGERVSIGRILSADPHLLSRWYETGGKEGSKPYVSVAHWGRALRVSRALGIEAVVNTLEHLLQVYYQGYVPQLSGDAEKSLEDIFEDYQPGFKAALEGSHEYSR